MCFKTWSLINCGMNQTFVLAIINVVCVWCRILSSWGSGCRVSCSYRVSWKWKPCPSASIVVALTTAGGPLVTYSWKTTRPCDAGTVSTAYIFVSKFIWLYSWIFILRLFLPVLSVQAADPPVVFPPLQCAALPRLVVRGRLCGGVPPAALACCLHWWHRCWREGKSEETGPEQCQGEHVPGLPHH